MDDVVVVNIMQYSVRHDEKFDNFTRPTLFPHT